MASRGARTYTAPVRSRALKAKCDTNQHLVDILAEKRERVAQSNYSFTLKRAMDSICKEKEPILSYDQVIKLSGIGPSIASLLFKKEAPKFAKSDKGKKKTTNTSSGGDSPISVASSTSRRARSAAESSEIGPPNKRPKPSKQNLQSLLTAKEAPSRKEVAYQKARKESDAWKGKNLTWKLVFLIDQRERKAEHYASKVQQCGIPTEIRTLPIGDMTWIAQGTDDNGNVGAELMLGTIVERKEVSDLKASLFGSRFNEQQLRLKDSGLPQVIFLIEGDIKNDLFRCPAETLHSTLWDIRLYKENQVIQTAHMEDTVQTLRRMHRRMLKRTFPTEFYSEALPSFADPVAGGGGRRKRDSFGEARKSRRRRLQSLHGLTFAEEPIPMAGMDRFISYKELRAKIERDRESGRRTVGSIHQAMLKQVARLGDAKIQSICEEYPTPTSILQAFDGAAGSQRARTLLQSIELHGPAQKKNTLGARSAAELYIAYGLEEADDSGEDTDENPRAANYTQLVQGVLSSQESVSDNSRSRSAQKTKTSSKRTETTNQLSTSRLPPIGEIVFTSDEEDETNKPTLRISSKPKAAGTYLKSAPAVAKKQSIKRAAGSNGSQNRKNRSPPPIDLSSSSDDDEVNLLSSSRSKQKANVTVRRKSPPEDHEIIEID